MLIEMTNIRNERKEESLALLLLLLLPTTGSLVESVDPGANVGWQSEKSSGAKKGKSVLQQTTTAAIEAELNLASLLATG